MRLSLKSALIPMALVVVLLPAAAEAQIGQLLSPGPMSTAHANLEGRHLQVPCASCHLNE